MRNLQIPPSMRRHPPRPPKKAKQRSDAAEKLAAAEEQWLELSSEYESGMAG